MGSVHKTITVILTMVTFFFLLTTVSSFYSQTIETKENEIDKLKKQNKELNSKIDIVSAKVDSLLNLRYKMVAGDSTVNKKTKVKEFFRIYKRDVMIESSYNIDMKYVDKIYASAQKVGVEPWLQLYYAHLENRINPYDKFHPGRIVRSNKDAYGIMQMTKIAVKEVNRKLNGKKYFKWEDVKYNTDVNIECSSYYMKFYIMPIYEEYKELPQVGDISFWFYNGGNEYGYKKLAWNGL